MLEWSRCGGQVTEMTGEEERWRDHTLWLLSGHAELLEIRCFYFHLRQTCDADPSQVARVKRAFALLRRQCWNLMKELSGGRAQRRK